MLRRVLEENVVLVDRNIDVHVRSIRHELGEHRTLDGCCAASAIASRIASAPHAPLLEAVRGAQRLRPHGGPRRRAGRAAPGGRGGGGHHFRRSLASVASCSSPSPRPARRQVQRYRHALVHRGRRPDHVDPRRRAGLADTRHDPDTMDVARRVPRSSRPSRRAAADRSASAIGSDPHALRRAPRRGRRARSRHHRRRPVPGAPGRAQGDMATTWSGRG